MFQAWLNLIYLALDLLFICATWQVQLITGVALAVRTCMRTATVFQVAIALLFLVLLRHLAVLAMENSVPLKNPCPAFNLLVDLHIAWVALSQGRFFINVPAFLLSGLPLGGS